MSTATLHGAKWIADPSKNAPINYAPIFRKEFSVSSEVSKATLKICGLGYHDVRINGNPITEEKLAPAFTAYSKRVYLSEYDVTAQIHTGNNAIAIELGRGFYAMNTANTWHHEKSNWHAEPKLICCLSLYAKDGTVSHVVSDQSFRCMAGPSIRACLYTGETVDGRIADAINGWMMPDFNDDSWQSAELTEPPMGELLPTVGPPIRVLETYAPVKIERISPDTQVVTFPYNITGWCEIHAKGKPGTEIKINYAEKQNEDKTVATENAFIEFPSQTDTYILGKDGVMDWEPKFSYKGFQYVAVIGEIEDLKSKDIVAKLVASDVRPKAEFECSVPLLNQIYEMVRRTMRNNLHSIPTDTPVYEKNGWLGDSGLMGQAFATLFDMSEFYQKWLTDMEDCITDEGFLPVIVPTAEWGMLISPEWWDCSYEIAWQVYLNTDDPSVLKRYYPFLQKQMRFSLTLIQDNGIAKSDLSDWIPPGYESRSPEGYGVVAPCFLRKSLLTLAKMADVLDDDTAAIDYRNKADALADAVNRNYFYPEEGKYETEKGGYRQANNVLPLAMGVVPNEYKQAVADRLAQDVKEKGNHLDTGILGTKFLLPVLSDHGYHELAYQLAIQTTYPSWGYWIANGMNTCLEAWEMTARSRNHFMFGTILDWLWKYIAGFSINETDCSKVKIAPRPVGELTHCRWSAEIGYGKLSADWQIENDVFTIDVALPDKAELELKLPNGEIHTVVGPKVMTACCKL